MRITLTGGEVLLSDNITTGNSGYWNGGGIHAQVLPGACA